MARATAKAKSQKVLKTIVEEALGTQRAKGLWTANFHPALPLTPQDFEVGALLPAMLYMARFGHRRGKGRFAGAFGTGAKQAGKKASAPTIAEVASGLIAREGLAIEGFETGQGPAALADLLLAACLENRKHAEGHDEPVQRCYPAHYLASWIDLPDSIANLRGVPEFLTALLADQAAGETVEPRGQGPFPVGVPYAENRLLAMFGRHMEIRGTRTSDLASDRFREEAADDVGIHELLTVRLAQACGSAPEKLRGAGESSAIPNRRPIAARAAEQLRGDLAALITGYGERVPRQTFLQMAEAGIALGLTNLILSSAQVLFEWERTGEIAAPERQGPWPLFVDCSHGQERTLRDLSEGSLTDCLRRYERFPVNMMLLRVLDDRVRTDRRLREQLPPVEPDAREYFELLGAVLTGRHPRSETLMDAFDEDCQRLAEGLTAAEGSPAPETAARLRQSDRSPALRLAEALCELMGDKVQGSQYRKLLDSAMMTGEPHGLAAQRRIAGQGDRRSLVLAPPLLDFLVHRHLYDGDAGRPGGSLSLPRFLDELAGRYGLYIDREPPGQHLPQEMLLDNKLALERRLRDLGLLIGVNDAESMKQLRPRYRPQG